MKLAHNMFITINGDISKKKMGLSMLQKGHVING
jgi:hypothetical protein